MVKVQIIGNIGRDAEIKEINGNKFVTFSVASDESWKRPDGTWQKSTTWVSVNYRFSEKSQLHTLLTKNTKVYVTGNLKVNVYQGKEGWQPGITCNSSVFDIDILYRPKDKEENGQTEQAPAANYGMSQAEQRMKAAGFESEQDIPF